MLRGHRLRIQTIQAIPRRTVDIPVDLDIEGGIQQREKVRIAQRRLLIGRHADDQADHRICQIGDPQKLVAELTRSAPATKYLIVFTREAIASTSGMTA